MSIRNKKSNRPYRHVTPQTIAKHLADKVTHGNGTRAIRETTPDYEAPDKRSQYIISVSRELATPEYIEKSMQQIALDAMQTLGNSVTSTDEAIALRASTYIIDHLRGKAVQRSENKNLNISIESVL